MLSNFLYISGSLANISDFAEVIVLKAGRDSSGISSHDGCKSDSDYNTEPSTISAISSYFNRKEL